MVKTAVNEALDAWAALDPERALARAKILLMRGRFLRAVKLLGVAANAGLADAQYVLGLRYLLGEGVAASETEAGLWFLCAAEAGHAGAQVKLAALHLGGLPQESLVRAGLFAPRETRVDFAAAAYWAERAALAGSAEACTLLAFVCTAAPPPWRDEAKAERLYEEAAAQGNARAQLALGLIRLRQERTAGGLALIERAAGAGLPHAPDALGAINENALGEAQDFTRSAAHFGAAAQARMARVIVRYGLALLLGRGVAQNALTADPWLRRAALWGSEEAALRLGRLYAEPGDLEPDYAESVIWFTRAAKAGNAEAARVLGVFALNGFGSAPDPVQAVRWFRRAAEAGDAAAAHYLAICQAQGIGVQRERTTVIE